MLAVGNPAFQSAWTGERPTIARATLRGAHSTCGDFGGLQFEPLPATEGEVRALDQLWKREGWPAEVLTGKAATEAAVKESASGLRVLHFATHGFFLANECQGNAVTRENPLLRSGLALAGANHRNNASASEEDGILTAEEAASLDLDGTDWVVLSGCDTGLGVIRSGEGVLGLRRAFLEAGAHTVITSLWPVEDEAARAWMTALYRARFQRGQTTAASLHRADVEMLRQRRAAGKSTHPFYWASFVAVGDWR
jgi:CHAT domain-containing protein